MQAFMQSLQMRWPVPGHIGLSIMTIANPAMASPSARSTFISPMRSSSGQPFSGTPSGFTLYFPSFSTKPWLQESFFRSWQKMQ